MDTMFGTATDISNNPGTVRTSWDVLASPYQVLLFYNPNAQGQLMISWDVLPDYTNQSSRSHEVLGQLETSYDVLPDMTTTVLDPIIPRNPGITQDIPRCPT